MNGLDIQVSEVENFINSLDDDFTYEFESGEEYRFIKEDCIWDIYYEEQKDQIEDLYLPDINKYWWIVIDWDKTIDNVFTSDGYGHHFSNYDGSEQECIILDSNYYIFRIN